jgi:hypothetical protein
MLSPVDFISGPNALFTLWNLKENRLFDGITQLWVESEISVTLL